MSVLEKAKTGLQISKGKLSYILTARQKLKFKNFNVAAVTYTVV